MRQERFGSSLKYLRCHSPGGRVMAAGRTPCAMVQALTPCGEKNARPPLLQLLHLLHLVELFFENRSLPIFDNEIWSLRLSCTRCAWKMAGIFSPQKYWVAIKAVG